MAGILAALAYSRTRSPSQFFWLALAATVFVSIITLFRRIPHKEDRIISYFIAGPGLGWLVPRLFIWLSW
jgi:lipoprotein signal peptidase